MAIQPPSRIGLSTILKAARQICRTASRLNSIPVITSLNPSFGAAVATVVAACEALRALDNFPGEIDSSATGAFGEDTGTGLEGDSGGPW